MVKFNVHLNDFQIIKDIPNVWTNDDLKNILDAADYGDVSEIPLEEVKEMCLMALSDFEPAEAAQLVLNYRLGNDLNDGQIQHLSHEMQEEPMWEEYPDMRFHEDIFYVNQLLFKAYNGKFPQPKAVQMTIKVSAKHPDGKAMLENPTEAFIVRLLAGGMDEHNPLIRLFEDQINGEVFPEAESIIWTFQKSGNADKAVKFQIIGSSYWLEDFKGVEMYETEAHPDMEEAEV